MASIEVHCDDCIKELGFAFREVHIWLDAYSKLFPPVWHGTKHRQFRHNENSVEFIRKRSGNMAAKAAEIHLNRDSGVNFGA